MPRQSSPVTRPFPIAHRVVLVHGAAVTSRIWRHVAAELEGLEVYAPERACTGSLYAEVAALAPLCEGAVVVGVSGGATLGLELAARGVAMRGAVLHEPAVGSLQPGLLAPMIEAWRDGGTNAFATTLYGEQWTPAEAPADPDAVSRDLAMFSAFEPRQPLVDPARVLVTVGQNSPARRHSAARVLADRFGFAVATIRGTGHAVHLAQPASFAALIRSVAAQT